MQEITIDYDASVEGYIDHEDQLWIPDLDAYIIEAIRANNGQSITIKINVLED